VRDGRTRFRTLPYAPSLPGTPGRSLLKIVLSNHAAGHERGYCLRHRVLLPCSLCLWFERVRLVRLQTLTLTALRTINSSSCDG